MCSMLSNSDIWLPSRRDNVYRADSSAGLFSATPTTPLLAAAHLEGAPAEKMGRAVLCTGNNGQGKVLGSLVLTRGTGMRSPWGARRWQDGRWAELPFGPLCHAGHL